MRLGITRKSDLALRALRHLARLDQPLRRNQFADAIDTTPAFLAQVMSPLVKAGWVASSPGRSGGYLLDADLRKISVLDVIEAVEGPMPTDTCVLRDQPCGVNPCELHDAWLPARAALIEQLRRSPLQS
jgi:Rrf2 family protein